MTRRRTIISEKDYDWLKNKRYLNPITGWSEAKVVKRPANGLEVLRRDRIHLVSAPANSQR